MLTTRLNISSGGINLSIGGKTKLLWQDPEYRKMQSLAHKGQQAGHRWKESHIPWNKGSTKYTDERIAKMAKANRHKKRPMKQKYCEEKGERARNLWKNPNYQEKIKKGMDKYRKKNPEKVHDVAIRAGLVSLESRKKKLPYKYLGIHFLSQGELACAKIFMDSGIAIEKGINCHVRIDKHEYDFILFDTFVIEYHPCMYNFRPKTYEEYYNKRRKLLDKSGYKDMILIVMQKPMELIKFLNLMCFTKLETIWW